MDGRVIPLASGYAVEVDAIQREQWYSVISNFEDCNIYQTWSYESARAKSNEISHLLLRKNETVVAAAQAKILRVPLLGFGVAYVRWGPLWKLRGELSQLDVLRQVLRAMRN